VCLLLRLYELMFLCVFFVFVCVRVSVVCVSVRISMYVCLFVCVYIFTTNLQFKCTRYTIGTLKKTISINNE